MTSRLPLTSQCRVSNLRIAYPKLCTSVHLLLVLPRSPTRAAKRKAARVTAPGGRCRHRRGLVLGHIETSLPALRGLSSCPYLSHCGQRSTCVCHIHLLKLLTGVEISTRPVKRSGSAGNVKARRTRSAAAVEKRTTLGWSW